MPSPFLTKPELRRLTGTDNAAEQIRVLKTYGLMPFAPNGQPIIYREAVIAVQREASSSTTIDLDALDAPQTH